MVFSQVLFFAFPCIISYPLLIVVFEISSPLVCFPCIARYIANIINFQLCMVFEISSPLFAFLVYYILCTLAFNCGLWNQFQVACFPCCWPRESGASYSIYLWKITKGRPTFMLVDFFIAILLRSFWKKRTEFYISFYFICKCVLFTFIIDHFQVHNNIILILNVKMYTDMGWYCVFSKASHWPFAGLMHKLIPN